MQSLRIGEVATRMGCTVETIRFYERKGLLAAPARQSSGYRLYGPDDIDRLRFIRKAKRLGFTLNEVRELLALRGEPVAACPDVQRQAEKKIDDIEARIATLEEMKEALADLVAHCKERTDTMECPILVALDSFQQES